MLVNPKKLILECECLSEIVVIEDFGLEDVDGNAEVYVEFYEAVPAGRRFKDRLRIMWSVLRGKEAWLHASVFAEPQVTELRDYCTQLLEQRNANKEGTEEKGDSREEKEGRKT